MRTGGAYVLKNLAHDYPEYREVAYTLLTNTIRDHSQTETLPLEPSRLAELENDRFAGKNSLRRRAPDLYAALRVLMTRDDLPGGAAFALGLNDTDLRGAVISGGTFRDADLRGARLDWADARPEGVDIRCAYLQGAGLFGAHLEGSDFGGAHLDAQMMTTPQELEEKAGFAFLGNATFDDSTTFVDENGRALPPEERRRRLESLGMVHKPGKTPCTGG